LSGSSDLITKEDCYCIVDAYSNYGKFKMFVELELRGPVGDDDEDDDNFEAKFLKRFHKVGNGFVFPDREVCL